MKSNNVFDTYIKIKLFKNSLYIGFSYSGIILF